MDDGREQVISLMKMRKRISRQCLQPRKTERAKLILRKKKKKARDGDSGHVVEGLERHFKDSGLPKNNVMPTVKLENRETRGRRPQRKPFQQSKGRTTVAWRRVGAERRRGRQS